MIVTPCRIEHSPFPAGANPGVGLAIGIADRARLAASRLKNRLVGIESTVPITLVHRLNRFQTRHDFVVCSNDLCFKASESVALELSADKLDVFVGVQETERGTVDWNQSAALFNKAKQCRLGSRRDLLLVSKDHQSVVLGEILWIDVTQVFSVPKLDRLFGERLGHVSIKLRGFMEPRVTKHQHCYFCILGSR